MCVPPRTQASLAVTALHRRGRSGELVDVPLPNGHMNEPLLGLADKRLLVL